MIKFLAVAAAATVIALASTPASAVTDLWALDGKGEPVRIKGFTSKTRVFSKKEFDHLNAGLKRTYSHRKMFCNQEFMLSTAQVRWLTVHSKARHRIVLRERLRHGRFRNVC
jgi:hypothetical protein